MKHPHRMHHLRHVKPHPRIGPFLAVAAIIIIAGFGLLWVKGGLQGLAAFEEGNQPPSWSGLAEIAVNPLGQTQVDLNSHARDPEGQRLVFTATAPEGLGIAVDRGVLELTAEPGFESGSFALFISDGVNVIRQVLQARVDQERYALRDSAGALFGRRVADDPFFDVTAAVVERGTDAVVIELGLVSSSTIEDVVEVAAASEFPFRLSSRELRTGETIRLEIPLKDGIIPRVELGIGRERLAIGELIPAAPRTLTGATAVDGLGGIEAEIMDIRGTLSLLLDAHPEDELTPQIQEALGKADGLLEAIAAERISLEDAARGRDELRQLAEPLLTGGAVAAIGPRAKLIQEIIYTALALAAAVAIAITAFLRSRRPAGRAPAKGKPELPESLDEEPSEPPAEAAEEPAAEERKEEEKEEAPAQPEEAKPEPPETLPAPPEPPKPAAPAPPPPPAPEPKQDEDESLEGKVLK